MKSITKSIFVLLLLIMGTDSAVAGDEPANAAVETASAMDEPQCLMIHVPQDDPKAFKQAINIANNIPKQMGNDTVRVEIIAQGPGLTLLTEGSPEAERIQSLLVAGEQTMGAGTKLSACAATINGIKKRTG